jgi:hypothetical protein
MTSITTTNVDLEHPYRGAGIVAVVLSIGVLAFSLGFLARCGGGKGLCFDFATHASGDLGLIAFLLLFIIGVALIVYTGSTASFATRTKTPAPPAPPVQSTTNVFPQAAAPQPTVTNVYPQAPANPSTTVVVNPPN